MEPLDETMQKIAGKTPRVSVICIFYQAERYFREAIDSVLAQDFQDFELLLVDDGSTDSSTVIAREFVDRDWRARYFDHARHENRGMSATRNLGIRFARGEFIAFIDADDRWRPSKLKEQVALLERFPEVDAVCGQVSYWASHGGGEDQIIATGHIFNTPVRPPEALLQLYPLGKADPPCPSDLLLRRGIVDAIGGFEESFTGLRQLYEDQAFLTKFYLRGTMYFSDRIWLDYRLHDGSCTSWVHRQGQLPQVRRYCLEWFESYLKGTPYRFDLRVRFALARALRPYRHPYVSAIGRRAKALVRGARAMMEQVGR